VRVNLFWFRRDLRLEDNAALYEAGRDGIPVLPLFIFDPVILRRSEDRKDRRVHYIHRTLQNIKEKLERRNSALLTSYDNPMATFARLLETYDVGAVYCNRDYEPEAIARDEEIASYCQQLGIPFLSFKDQVIFEGAEIKKQDGSPYTVFTPYAKRWKMQVQENLLPYYPSETVPLAPHPSIPLPSLEDLGFEAAALEVPELNPEIVQHYALTRDLPGIPGTTRIGTALRFGTLSIRHCVRIAHELSAETWLNELIWREFFMQILFHFPHVINASFKPQYDRIPWRNREDEFALWCAGNTGYPLVDAGMRELNATGFMHNRVRMVVASFLCKHLLIDWRWGEAYFAQKLNDYELSSNNGNWQWAAGSGCDAAPYFRVFNPERQAEKFDKEQTYIRKWVPEWGSSKYPSPMVEHAFARKRALETYQKGLNDRN
jgi:deoxyribodipyrimidine photo-lyase